MTSIHRLCERVEQLVQEGAMTPAQGQKLVGSVMLDSAGIELGSRTTRWRHRKQLRHDGLILADGTLQDGEIDLSGELDEVFDGAFTDAP